MARNGCLERILLGMGDMRFVARHSPAWLAFGSLLLILSGCAGPTVPETSSSYRPDGRPHGWGHTEERGVRLTVDTDSTGVIPLTLESYEKPFTP